MKNLYVLIIFMLCNSSLSLAFLYQGPFLYMVLMYSYLSN